MTRARAYRGQKRRQAMANVETGTVQMITALRDGLHGLHLARMALVAESKALRLAGRKAERDAVWSRVEELTAQIEVTSRELSEHMLLADQTQRRGDAEARWTELIPCPFCGGVAKHAFGMDKHWVLCTVCGACGKMETTRQHAVDAWNTRTAYLPDDRRSGG
jgi:Lar family restriction alleviation protein